MEHLLDHPFQPVFNSKSYILILGSFPSEASRKYGFYYSHPQNRFWQVISHLTQTTLTPTTIDEKKKMLLNNYIALWDIVQSCNISGSSDSSMKNINIVNLQHITNNSKIRQIFANGTLAYNLCIKNSINALKLPSTSSANAKYNLEKLIDEWRVILNFLYY